jgi:TolA-binding protein
MTPIPPRMTESRRWAPGLLSCLLALVVTLGAVVSCDAGGVTPKSPAVQVKLAEELTAAEDWAEAPRRWINVLYYFGPSDQEARAEFELGALALRTGRSDVAATWWERAVSRHQENEWSARAAEALKLLGKEVAPFADVPAEPYVTAETPPDERTFKLAEAEVEFGLHTLAIRDYLKVPNLYPESPRAPEARFRVGTLQVLLGHPELAIGQWTRLIEEHPDSQEARRARGGIAAWNAIIQAAGVVLPEPDGGAWAPFRDRSTEPNRGLSYAEDLYENGILDYAFQEYTKVLCDLYTPKGGANPHCSYARYRMGVCAYRLGEPDAAGRQWRLLIADAPEDDWSRRATAALSAVGRTDPFSSAGGRLAPAVPTDLPNALVKRSCLAEQLTDCGLPNVAVKEHLKVMFVLTALRPNAFQAEACYGLGRALHLRGRPDLAIPTWKRVMAEYPGTPWADKAETSAAQAEQRESVITPGISPPEDLRQ